MPAFGLWVETKAPGEKTETYTERHTNSTQKGPLTNPGIKPTNHCSSATLPMLISTPIIWNDLWLTALVMRWTMILAEVGGRLSDCTWGSIYLTVPEGSLYHTDFKRRAIICLTWYLVLIWYSWNLHSYEGKWFKYYRAFEQGQRIRCVEIR